LFVIVDVNIDKVAHSTIGFTGADLENIVNQAALKAANDSKEMVTTGDLEFAMDKIMMGGCIFMYMLHS
jgi:ATP-dependent Zn protease